jgi:hypothetical protein
LTEVKYLAWALNEIRPPINKNAENIIRNEKAKSIEYQN